MEAGTSRSLFEKLLYLGIATFFLWPFIQLYSVKAIPIFDSDTHLRASVALENLMEEALCRPYEFSIADSKFVPIKGYEDLNLMGKIDISPHPIYNSNVLIKAQVMWGSFPLQKNLSLEYIGARTKS
jgi:hypothetical protein